MATIDKNTVYSAEVLMRTGQLKSSRQLVLLALLTLPGLAIAAPNRPGDVPAGLRTWLLALESVPVAAQLQQAGGKDVDLVLDRVVRDDHERGYARHRAMSFLGILDGTRATELLRRNLKIRDPALRATAAIAWAAGPGRRDAGKNIGELDRLLNDPVPAVRAAAARGLAFLPDRRLARDHALQRRERETVPEVIKALDRTVHQLNERAN